MTLREEILKESLKDYKQKYYDKKVATLDAQEKRANENLTKLKISDYKTILKNADEFNKCITYLNDIIGQIKDVGVSEETLNKLDSIKRENGDKLKRATDFISNFIKDFDGSKYITLNTYINDVYMNKEAYKSKLKRESK